MVARSRSFGRAVVAATAVAVVVAVVAACQPATPSSDPASPGAGAGGSPVSATAQRDGVVVTVALSSDRIAAGGAVDIRVSALNAGLGAVTYENGGCGLVGRLAIAGPPGPAAPQVGAPPAGDGVDAALALARWSALAQAAGGLEMIRPDGVPGDGPVACPADLRFDTIDPAATARAGGSWTATTGDGAPATAGEYRVTFSFPFAGRDLPGDPLTNPNLNVVPIDVAVALTVLPGPTVAVTAERAIDAAIADPAVRAWAAGALTRQTLSGATIRVVDGRWRWRVMHAGGTADVWVDATSGAVVERSLH